MNKWGPHKLSEIGSIVGGATPSTTIDAYYNGDIPWLTPKDLSNFHERYIERGERNITKSGLNSCSAQLLPAGSVLFSSRAPIGYVAIAKNPIATNQGFKSIIPNPEKVDSLFLYYLLKYNKDNIEAMGSGTTFKEVSGATMKNIEVYLPEDLEEQRRIAGILGSLDDKIELNRRINANLEAQAQALFRSWFVDFEPFRDGPFVDSELGKIPQGWKVGTFQDIINITSGKRPPLKVDKCTSEAYIPVYGASSIQAYTTSFLRNEDLLLIGRVGTLGIVQKVTGLSWPSDNTLIITSPFYEYSYQILKTIDFNKLNRGSTQPLITQTDIKNQTILLPPNEVLYQYEKISANMFSLNKKNNSEIITLSALRDTLLPKLMAGEIKI